MCSAGSPRSTRDRACCAASRSPGRRATAKPRSRRRAWRTLGRSWFEPRFGGILPVVNQPPDTVIRALTQDGAFRVIVALTTSTVKDTVLAQDVRGTTAQRLGELVTGAI